MVWNVPVCHWLPQAITNAVLYCHLASPHPPWLSSLSLWAHVCFCSCLQPAWLTTMILTKRMERSRLDLQIASEQSALSLRANSVSSLPLSLSPSLHRSIFISLLHLCVYLEGGVSGRIGSRIGEFALLCSSWPTAGWELWTWKHWASLPEWHLSTDQHDPAGCMCVWIYKPVLWKVPSPTVHTL